VVVDARDSYSLEEERGCGEVISWATDKAYLDLVARRMDGPTYRRVPARLSTEPGIPESRTLRAKTLESMDRRGSESTRPSSRFRTSAFSSRRYLNSRASPPTVGQDFSAALAGSMTVDAALAAAQSSSEAAMKKAGYIK